MRKKQRMHKVIEEKELPGAALNSLLPSRSNGVSPLETSSETSAAEFDPLVPILGWFAALPSECHEALFADFADAAQKRDLRRLLDAISDWAATAELYAHPELAEEVREALPTPDASGVRPSVAASLEKSIQENAAVWRALANH